MRTLFVIATIFSVSLLGHAQLVIDHTCTDLGSIPADAINTAKANLHIAYGHTSHGSQLTEGMSGLIGQTTLNGYQGDIYAFNTGGTDGALDLRDYAMGGDVGYYPDWVNNTTAYLNDPDNANVNVIIWSWCGQAAGYTEQQMIDRYLQPMTELEETYPNVTFVYMTCHLNGTGADGNLNQRNEQIRAYCQANGKTLYDFADIESYGPDGQEYMTRYADDACNYDSNGDTEVDTNWAQVWQNTHTEGVDWYDCGSAHSEPLNANRKAYAAWWLWASLGGWAGEGEGECEGEGEGELTFTETPRGGWKEEGDRLVLSVGVEGSFPSLSYQWIKDGDDLPGETEDTFIIDSLTTADSGYYWVSISDGSKAECPSKTTWTTDPVLVTVFPAGSLPAVSLVGLGIAGLGVISVSRIALARRKKRS